VGKSPAILAEMKRPLIVLVTCGTLACSSSERSPEMAEPAPPNVRQLGDGSLASVSFTVIYESNERYHPSDLDFHPSRDELWVVFRQPLSEAPCTEQDDSGCAALWGSTAIITAPGSDSPQAVFKQDQNAWHFLRSPTSIAFGSGDTFATCGEARTGNYTDTQADYMGPTLWSSDPAVFAVEPSPGGNGSHLDMLHETPFCMGVAHESGNVYWTHNGQLGALDRYDFREPHEPGGEDHSDGEVLRYVVGDLLRVPEVSSHLVFDPRDASLYVADTGHGRILRLASDTGRVGEPFPPLDPIRVSHYVEDAVLEELVPPGTLEAPSGLALLGNALLVTDHATGDVVAFDLDGRELIRLPTGRARALGGIAVGPDDKAYFVDMARHEIIRLDPLVPP
jgi:hypothetical protein